MAPFDHLVACILVLVSPVKCSNGLVGKDFCHIGYGYSWAEEFRLSFVNFTHMTFSSTQFLLSRPETTRYPGTLVTGIPYKFNPISGIIDANTKDIKYSIFYYIIKSKDMHNIKYDELKEVIEVEMRYKLLQTRQYRPFRRC
ncbi:hypothetical protein FOZ63_020490 [Perkinsus olseni]|uniref:Uncharacterized protein n=1 Tax=Perkinsus olseni TaxID=32597 RepID=A0A7J6PSP0_PEROL|nr:hypothetical protein FOZ63_020490 [Perkinsus olseni]